jgi:hypothetical protein
MTVEANPNAKVELKPTKEHPVPAVRTTRTVLQMRIAGYSFDEIAEILSFEDADAVKREMERGAKALLKEDRQSAAMLRAIVGRRLERMTRAVYTKAIDPDHAEQMVAQQRALANIDRYIKLYGLDAPVEHKVEITPTEQAIADMVTQLANLGQLPEEMNIFEAELVEDDDDSAA